MLVFFAMNTVKKKQPKTISVQLSPEDQDLIDRIAREFGLIKDTDCLRLALREAVRRIEAQTVPRPDAGPVAASISARR